MQVVAESLIFVKYSFIFVFFYSRDNDCTIRGTKRTVRTKLRVRKKALITLLIHGSVSTVTTTFSRYMYFLCVTVLNGNRAMVPGIASNVFDIQRSKTLHIHPWRSNTLLKESMGWHHSNSILFVLSKVVTTNHNETWSILCGIPIHVNVYMTRNWWELDSNGSGPYRIEYVHNSKCLIDTTSWSSERLSLWISLFQ